MDQRSFRKTSLSLLCVIESGIPGFVTRLSGPDRAESESANTIGFLEWRLLDIRNPIDFLRPPLFQISESNDLSGCRGIAIESRFLLMLDRISGVRLPHASGNNESDLQGSCSHPLSLDSAVDNLLDDIRDLF